MDSWSQQRRTRRSDEPRDRLCKMSVAIPKSLTLALLLIILGIANGLNINRHNFKQSLVCRSGENDFGLRPHQHNYNRNQQHAPSCLHMGYQVENDDTISSESKDLKEQTKVAIEKLMTEHDPILLFASRLLPPDKAEDASALYAWCRRLDEICDNEEDASGGMDLTPVRDNLAVWQARFDALWSANTESKASLPSDYTNDEYLMDLALKRCIEKYQGNGMNTENNLLTRVPFDDMIEGMKSDAVEGRRIQTMQELELYAYRVAGTVGLMLLPLLLSEGDKDDSFDRTLSAIEISREPAICLGQAIQLVNILRDATQDAKLGRIYLPQDMLSAEGVEDRTILELGLSASLGVSAPDGYKNVVKSVSARALELLAIAEEGKGTLPAPLGPIFVQIIVELYRDYLNELECRDYDNLSKSGDGEDRVKISTLRKVKASWRALEKVGKELIGLKESES